MHILKASLLNIVGRVVSILSTLVSIFLLGRLFDPAEFGYWTWLFSIFSLITAQDFGFIAAMRVRIGRAIVDKDFSEQKLSFAVAMSMSVLAGVILMLCSGAYIGSGTDKALDIMLVTAVSLITVVGYCASQGTVAYLQSGWVGIAESVRGVLQIGVILCAKFAGLNFEITFALFYLFSMLYTPFITAVFLRSRHWAVADLMQVLSNDVPKSIYVGVRLLKEGGPLWLMQIGLAFLSLSDVFIAGLLIADDEVAVVNAIVRLVVVAVGFVMAAMTPVMGHFVAKMDVLDRDTVWKRYSEIASVLVLVGALYGIFLYFFGPTIIQVWANLSVSPSYVFVVAGLLFSVMGMVILLQTFMQMPVFTKATLPILLTAAVVKILIPFLIVPMMGYEGIFLSSFLVNAGFVLVATLLLFKGRYIDKILFKSHA